MRIIPLAAALTLCVTAAHADISYSGYGLIGENATISIAGETIYAGMGEIQLYTPTGTVNAWCIDLQHWLFPSGDFAEMAPDAGWFNTAAALIYDTPVDPTPLEAAVTQAAIWIDEYGSAVTITPDNPVTLPDAVALLRSVEGQIGGPLTVLSQDGNQTLTTKAGEPVGAAVMGVGLLGLGWARRRTERSAG